MKYLKGCVIVCLGLLMGCGLYAQTQGEKVKYRPNWYHRTSLFQLLSNDKDEIIFLGDSITANCNWSELFQDKRIKNRGIGGDVTQGVLDRLDEIVESQPLKVFLMIGINDLGKGKTEKEAVTNIKRIIKSLQKKSAETEIYLQSLLPVNRDLGMFPNYTNKTAEILAVNRVLKRMAEEFSCTFIDLYPLFIEKDQKLNPAYTNDGLHLNGEGYLVWKTAVKKYVGSPSVEK